MVRFLFLLRDAKATWGHTPPIRFLVTYTRRNASTMRERIAFLPRLFLSSSLIVSYVYHNIHYPRLKARFIFIYFSPFFNQRLTAIPAILNFAFPQYRVPLRGTWRDKPAGKFQVSGHEATRHKKEYQADAVPVMGDEKIDYCVHHSNLSPL